MKIVKRDGRTVDYDASKIRVAISKANNEVLESERISEDEIASIVQFIESLNKKRILVEDIQDIIEEKLMAMGHFSLAKKYIIYRYTRSIIRKSNTTDASILSLLKNGEYNTGTYLTARRQRDVMAGEASKDLAYRLLLPLNVVNSDKDNSIKFCNVEYFTEPIIESVKIDLEKVLSGGCVINEVLVDEPKSFQSASNVLVEIIAEVANAQTGDVYVNFSDLFKYYYLSFEKYKNTYSAVLKNKVSQEEVEAVSRTQTFLEISSGIQTLFYQINTINLANGKTPKVYFLVNPNDAKNDIEEQIIHELLRQRRIGVKNNSQDELRDIYPMIIYCCGENEKHQYLKNEILTSNFKCLLMNEERYVNFFKSISYFNQGSIILNLGHLALQCENDMSIFIENLNRCLSYCYEGMLCRNHNLQGVYSDKSPIHWTNGVIANYPKATKIDELLKKDYSYMNLVVVGFEVAVSILGEELKKEIVNVLDNQINEWNKESSFKVCLSNYYDEKVVDEIRKKDEIEFKKSEIKSYFDSYDFQKDNYFKDGFLYVVNYTNENDIYDELGDKFIFVTNTKK